MTVARERIAGMILVPARRLGAGMARARPGDRDEAGEDRAEERQEDDRGIHPPQPFIMLTSSTAIDPRFR